MEGLRDRVKKSWQAGRQKKRQEKKECGGVKDGVKSNRRKNGGE